MKRSFSIRTVALSVVLLGATAFISADTFMIDDFSVPASGSQHKSKTQLAWYDMTSTVMGGIRDGSVGCESAETDGQTTAQIIGGKFTVTTNKKASPSIYLSYDQTAGWGNDKDTDPFNGVLDPVQDLTDGGVNNTFSIVFASAAGRDTEVPYFNDFLLTVKIKNDATLHQCNLGYKGTGTANVWMEENYATLNAGTPVAFDILFSELSGTVDMSQVEGFALHICSENYNLDYSLDSISTTVPEPATLCLLSAGGAITLIYRKHGHR